MDKNYSWESIKRKLLDNLKSNKKKENRFKIKTKDTNPDSTKNFKGIKKS